MSIKGGMPDPRLKRAGVSGFNQPKRTPSHPTKSHIVVAKTGDQVKTIRFGQQGVSGSPDGSKRNEAFKARHAKNIAKGKMSAAYWADRVKWTIVPIGISLLLGVGGDHAERKFAGADNVPALWRTANGAG